MRKKSFFYRNKNVFITKQWKNIVENEFFMCAVHIVKFSINYILKYLFFNSLGS